MWWSKGIIFLRNETRRRDKRLRQTVKRIAAQLKLIRLAEPRATGSPQVSVLRCGGEKSTYNVREHGIRLKRVIGISEIRSLCNNPESQKYLFGTYEFSQTNMPSLVIQFRKQTPKYVFFWGAGVNSAILMVCILLIEPLGRYSCRLIIWGFSNTDFSGEIRQTTKENERHFSILTSNKISTCDCSSCRLQRSWSG